MNRERGFQFCDKAEDRQHKGFTKPAPKESEYFDDRLYCRNLPMSPHNNDALYRPGIGVALFVI